MCVVIVVVVVAAAAAAAAAADAGEVQTNRQGRARMSKKHNEDNTTQCMQSGQTSNTRES
jgi:hypothetical protein